jgi:hypothetical protein
VAVAVTTVGGCEEVEEPESEGLPSDLKEPSRGEEKVRFANLDENEEAVGVGGGMPSAAALPAEASPAAPAPTPTNSSYAALSVEAYGLLREKASSCAKRPAESRATMATGLMRAAITGGMAPAAAATAAAAAGDTGVVVPSSQ